VAPQGFCQASAEKQGGPASSQDGASAPARRRYTPRAADDRYVSDRGRCRTNETPPTGGTTGRAFRSGWHLLSSQV